MLKSWSKTNDESRLGHEHWFRMITFARTTRSLLTLVCVVGASAALAGCSPTVALNPAENANAPECAEVTVRLPDVIEDLALRTTDAQATAAWGEPTAVILTCGVEPPRPTTLQCVTIGAVDWIVDDSDLPNLRLTTYGRQPAAQAYVDTSRLSADAALGALASAVQKLPKTGACTAPDTDTDTTTDEDASTPDATEDTP